MLRKLGGDLRLDFYHGRIFFQPYSKLPNQKYHGVKIMQ